MRGDVTELDDPPPPSLLSPGVDHDVLSDLRVPGVGGDVERGPAVPVGEVGVGSKPDHESDDLETPS